MFYQTQRIRLMIMFNWYIWCAGCRHVWCVLSGVHKYLGLQDNCTSTEIRLLCARFLKKANENIRQNTRQL